MAIKRSEAFAVGMASTAALVVALVGVQASLRGSIHGDPVSLGIFVASVVGMTIDAVVGRSADKTMIITRLRR